MTLTDLLVSQTSETVSNICALQTAIYNSEELMSHESKQSNIAL